jgi:hypothetical protein
MVTDSSTSVGNLAIAVAYPRPFAWPRGYSHFRHQAGRTLEALEPAASHRVCRECQCCDWPLDDLEDSQGGVAGNEHEVSLVTLEHRFQNVKRIRYATRP